MAKHVKAKVMKKSLGDSEDITHMFNQMLGVEEPELDIVREKHNCIVAKSAIIEKLINSALESIFVRLFGETQAKACDEIRLFVDNIPGVCKCKGEEASMVKCYVAMKTSPVVSHIIQTCKVLMEYKPGLDSEEPFRSYVMRMPNLELKIFSFSSLDIKSLFVDDLDVCKYMMVFMPLMLTTCITVYKTVASPDVDVDEFSDIIMSSIDQLETVQELNRCRKAFDKIRQSVKLLVCNFDCYYKDFIQSRNPTSIMENFIFDVAETSKSDPQVTRQFREIIKYYKKATAGKIKDPKIQKLFETLGNFNESL